jgi:hypothetical protein
MGHPLGIRKPEKVPAMKWKWNRIPQPHGVHQDCGYCESIGVLGQGRFSELGGLRSLRFKTPISKSLQIPGTIGIDAHKGFGG